MIEAMFAMLLFLVGYVLYKVDGLSSQVSELSSLLILRTKEIAND